MLSANTLIWAGTGRNRAARARVSKYRRRWCPHKSNLQALQRGKAVHPNERLSTRSKWEKNGETININYLAALASHIYHVCEATNLHTRWEEVRRGESGYEYRCCRWTVFMVGWGGVEELKREGTGLDEDLAIKSHQWIHREEGLEGRDMRSPQKPSLENIIGSSGWWGW